MLEKQDQSLEIVANNETNVLNKNNKGFSLIEVLVVVTLTAGIAATVYGAYLGFKALNKYINTPKVQVERTNVLGDQRAEQFVDFEGKRFYSEIDGNPVADYFRSK